MKPKNRKLRLKSRQQHHENVLSKIKNATGYHKPGSQKR